MESSNELQMNTKDLERMSLAETVMKQQWEYYREACEHGIALEDECEQCRIEQVIEDSIEAGLVVRGTGLKGEEMLILTEAGWAASRQH